LGEAGEGKNVTHQQKKLNEQELARFRTRFGIPISDEEVASAPFYRPPEDSPEIGYLKERREALGGALPQRGVRCAAIDPPDESLFDELHSGSDGREVSTTMAFVRVLTKLLDDPSIGDLIVPIIPDEARTFGMESLFRKVGIYAHGGQLYEPVDANTLLYYKEAKNGQILEEGITEAGSMSSFIAAGTAHANHGINTIPFFIFYSMFGFQRIGDLIWAAADMRTRGFLIGGTAGRTTLAGEGLQHQDGQSHLLAYPVPNLLAYDPAYAYEIAVIVREGIRRMYENQEDVFYYLTVENETYEMPPMPEGAEDGILKGMYRLRSADTDRGHRRAHLFGAGAILNEALRAAAVLADRYNVAADTYSVTSFKELYKDGLEVERWNRLHPAEERRRTYIEEQLDGTEGVYVIASDYVAAMASTVCRWFPKRPVTLGTDGFGRSDARSPLRDFFEVDWRHICIAVLGELAREGTVEMDEVHNAIIDLDVDVDADHPMYR
jgi:pyruvate dehydrogenase E1 component